MGADSHPQLSIVIPAYNEAAVIRPALLATAGYLEKQALPWEIIVVNDGSRDATLLEAEKVAADLGKQKVKVLSHPKNRGKGSAVKTGVLAAAGEIVLFCDADGATPIEELARFLPRFKNGADLVVGSRRLSQSQIKQRQRRLRQWMGTVYVRLTRLLIGVRVSDITCGFKALRRPVAQDLFSRMRIEGWSFDAEMFFLARKKGYGVVEMPIQWADRPSTKVRLLKDAARSFGELLKIRLQDSLGKYGRGH
ncbi:MAG: glycosyltransferase family 2 protein [Candidatus Omnitrophica bacterium]|nr:glycosyltransferase family 2 protein [Candidatus Omnitrophota bacterium]